MQSGHTRSAWRRSTVAPGDSSRRTCRAAAIRARRQGAVCERSRATSANRSYSVLNGAPLPGRTEQGIAGARRASPVGAGGGRMKTVFVDVDTQIDFVYPAGALYAPGAETIVPALVRLNRHAAASGIPVISTMDAHTENDPEFRHWPAHCVAGTIGQQKVP